MSRCCGRWILYDLCEHTLHNNFSFFFFKILWIPFFLSPGLLFAALDRYFKWWHWSHHHTKNWWALKMVYWYFLPAQTNFSVLTQLYSFAYFCSRSHTRTQILFLSIAINQVNDLKETIAFDIACVLSYIECEKIITVHNSWFTSKQAFLLIFFARIFSIYDITIICIKQMPIKRYCFIVATSFEFDTNAYM